MFGSITVSKKLKKTSVVVWNPVSSFFIESDYHTLLYLKSE
jgi:hypothetical protein